MTDIDEVKTVKSRYREGYDAGFKKGLADCGEAAVLAHDKLTRWIVQQYNEIERLRATLFQIQTEQLDRGTDMRLSALKHRQLAMNTRDFIIATLQQKEG